MEITGRFTFPDVDCEINEKFMDFELFAEVENSTDHECSLITGSSGIFSSNGVGVGGDSFNETIDLPPGDTYSLSRSAGHSVFANFFPEDTDEIKGIVNIKLFGKRDLDLGIIDVPGTSGDTAELVEGFKTNDGIEFFGAACYLVVDDDCDEPDAQVTIVTQLSNVGEEIFEKLKVSAVLKSDNEEIEENYDEITLGSAESFPATILFWIPASKVENLKVELKLSVFYCIDSNFRDVTFYKS